MLTNPNCQLTIISYKLKTAIQSIKRSNLTSPLINTIKLYKTINNYSKLNVKIPFRKETTQ